MKRLGGIFALTASLSAVMPAIADAAVLGGGDGGCGSGWPFTILLVPFC